MKFKQICPMDDRFTFLAITEDGDLALIDTDVEEDGVVEVQLLEVVEVDEEDPEVGQRGSAGCCASGFEGPRSERE